jgi:hypothetical protein
VSDDDLWPAATSLQPGECKGIVKHMGLLETESFLSHITRIQQTPILFLHNSFFFFWFTAEVGKGEGITAMVL